MIRRSLSIKLIASLTFIILFIFLVSGYATFRVYLRLFHDEISKQFAKANEQAAARVEFKIQNMVKSTNYIVFHPYIEDILRRSAERDDDSRFERILDQDELTQLLNQISIDEPQMTTMYLYNTRGSGYFFENDSGTVIPLDEETYEAIERSLEGSNGELVWQPLRIRSIDSSGYRNVVSVSRYMKNKSQELYGTLILFYDREVFGFMLDELAQDDGAQVALLDADRKVIYSNPANADVEPLLGVEESDFVRMDGDSTFVIRSPVNDTGLSLISTLPVDSVNEQSRVILQIALFSGFASVLGASLLIFLTGRRLLRPVHTLVQGMRRLREGKFETRLSISTQDELAFLGQSFNSMAENIEALIKEVYERKLNEREAELTALQAQLNPHFLYNTLDTIYLKLYLGEHDEQAGELVLALSGLLRYALQKAHTETTVLDEIEHIRKYIRIQSARIGDRLETFIQMEEEAERVPIIRLILQPLVENAFVHAFARQSRTCVLRIKASLIEHANGSGGAGGRALCIEVSDNGAGMDADQLRRIRRMQDDDWEERAGEIGGIGLKTVVRRVKLLYGDPYGIEVESEPGSGTTMRLILPAKQQEGSGSTDEG